MQLHAKKIDAYNRDRVQIFALGIFIHKILYNHARLGLSQGNYLKWFSGQLFLENTTRPTLFYSRQDLNLILKEK